MDGKLSAVLRDWVLLPSLSPSPSRNGVPILQQRPSVRYRLNLCRRFDLGPPRLLPPWELGRSDTRGLPGCSRALFPRAWTEGPSKP